MNRKYVSPLIFAGLLLAAAAWKLIFLLKGVVPFNSDEAIVALMARHILQGERPVFFYGQSYMGSLDAWLAAGGFALFGQQVWVIRLVQTLLYLGTIFTSILLGRRLFGSWKAGLLAGALLAIPAVNTTLYTTASLGGYGEALLIGNLLILVSYQEADRKRLLLWSVLAGAGLWANGLTLVYSAPTGLYLLWKMIVKERARGELIARLGVIASGMLLGALPWVLFALSNGLGSLTGELAGKAVAVESGGWISQVGSHALSLVLFGLTALFGFRPPWDVTWLALPLAPLALAFWMAVLAWTAKQPFVKGQGRVEVITLAAVGWALLAGFLFTPFGVDPSGRYFLPLAVVLSIFAGGMLERALPKTAWQVAVVGLVAIFNAWGTFQCAARPPYLTTQFYAPSQVDHAYDGELIRFLQEQGETRGYTNYWVSYPLAFLSNESLIYLPMLPYHPDLSYTARDNRYPNYNGQVEQSERVTYINTNNPPAAEQIRQGLARMKVTWQEKKIGDYEVFYHLSRPVRPQELGFGDRAAVEGQVSQP